MKEQETVRKELLIIRPHSMVDLITNSSSELFVCRTGKTLETVRELLIDMLNLQNKLFDSNLRFEECFEEPYYITEDNFEDYFKEYVDNWGITQSPYDKEKNYNNLKQRMIGYIIIRSASDNSVPYELFDMIESSFGANRYHLG